MARLDKAKVVAALRELAQAVAEGQAQDLDTHVVGLALEGLDMLAPSSDQLALSAALDAAADAVAGS